MRTQQDPSANPILNLIEEAKSTHALTAALDMGKRCAVVGSAGSSTSFLSAAVSRRTGRPVLLVVAHPDDADEAVDELTSGGVDAARFPALELTPGESHVSLELFAERQRILRAIGEAPPTVLVGPIHAIMQRLPSAGDVGRSMRTIARGETLDPGDLVRWLDDAGYRRVDAIEDIGEFAVRGGILDVFPPATQHAGSVPVRFDFFGDTLDGLHEIDPDTMGSDRALECAELIGANADAVRSSSEGAAITQLLGARWLAILHEPIEILEQARGYFERVVGDGEVLAPPLALKHLNNDLGAVCEVSQFAAPADGVTARFDLPVSNLPPFSTEAHEAVRELDELAHAAGTTIVFCQNQGELDRLGELLIEAASVAPIERRLAYVHRGFIWGDEEAAGTIASSGVHKNAAPAHTGRALAVAPYHELMHRFQMRRRTARVRSGRSLDVFLDLEPGDYAVHQDHGLCRFIGLTTMKRRDMEKFEEEFLTLEFAQRATIHIAVTQIDKVQRYVGGFRGKPPLSTLGSRRWKSQKEKVTDAVHDLAGEMLRVQAARASLPGVRYPLDTPWQREFDDEFPYEETEGQLAAMAEIKRDLHSERPMDRLLCGDVGYGKTELAIRAAFKVAEFGKQVAILVPTTILAEQHERTFRERFADYPFRVESLSRFKSPGDQRRVLADLAAGRVDIIIGTHRLLSSDVGFSDLGLVVVDEEQRFGVEHKQSLLSLRMTVDVLTLSATPIPRTLHLALLGLRDISSLTTAPSDRRRVVTEVTPFNRERIRRAIARELARDGQVFFVHNRVKSINRAADVARELAPKARIVIGHGQMPSKELEKVMLAFVRREADILVCTTIIESGVDIPTANTMVITDADRFGLADLHQLRGRVGRYKHRAFCLMLLPESRPITEIATRRLQAIEEFSMLGAGFKIAMRDLEIRGAGNLLGAEQSGHIAAVGYEMYCRLLEHAVKSLKNEPIPHDPAETSVDISVFGLLPAGYISSVKRRIEAYRRLAMARALEDVRRLERDLAQAYGKLPRAASRLLDLTELRISAGALGIRTITIDGPDVVIRCADPRPVARALANAKGTVRTLSPKHPGAGAEVYYRPSERSMTPVSLLAVLRTRFQSGGSGDAEHAQTSIITHAND